MALNWTDTRQAGLTHGYKCLVWGESGMGKTTLTGTLPANETVILSAEAGLLSIRHLQIPVLVITCVQDLEDAYNYLCRTDSAWCKNVCLDSVTEIGEVVLSNAKATVKDPRQAYGELIEKMTKLLKQFRDLPGRNVVFLAKAERNKDEVTGISMNGPSMPGSKLGQQLPYLFDEVFRIAVGVDPTTKQKFRYIQTQPDMQNVCKDRSGSLAEIEPPDLSYIFAKIASAVPASAETPNTTQQ